MTIRRFTLAAARFLSLRAALIGRPDSELRVNFNADVEAQVAHALHTPEAREQDVQDARESWFSLRTRPSPRSTGRSTVL
jgi:hypothetical protein